MHDAVGHRVSLMVLQAGAIEMAATDRERVEQLADQVQVAGRQALDELRTKGYTNEQLYGGGLSIVTTVFTESSRPVLETVRTRS